MRGGFSRKLVGAALVVGGASLATSAFATSVVNTWDFQDTKEAQETTSYSPTNPGTVSPSGNSIDVSTSAAFTTDGETLTALPFTYTPFPLTLSPFSANTLTPSVLSYSSLGIGVCEPTEGGGECKQVGTNGLNELIELQFTAHWQPISITLTSVDKNDTFVAFGLPNGSSSTSAVTLSPSGVISQIGTGAGDTYTINFAGDSGFEDLFITTAIKGGLPGGTTQDFTIEDFTGVQVPEPASLILLGTGLLGAGFLRRRRA